MSIIPSLRDDIIVDNSDDYYNKPYRCWGIEQRTGPPAAHAQMWTYLGAKCNKSDRIWVSGPIIESYATFFGEKGVGGVKNCCTRFFFLRFLSTGIREEVVQKCLNFFMSVWSNFQGVCFVFRGGEGWRGQKLTIMTAHSLYLLYSAWR